MTNYNVSILEPRGVFFDSTPFDTALFDNSAQTVSVSDSLAAGAAHFATMTESKSISDSITAQLGALRNISEGAISILDSILAQVLHIVNIYEPARKLFDDIFFDNSFFDDSAQTYSISDSVSTSSDHFASLNEAAITITDALDRVYGAIVNMANETVAIFENITAQGGFFRNISDPQGFFDSTFFDNSFFDTLVHSITIADQVVASYAATVEMAETVIIADLISVGSNIVRVINEAANAVSDIVARAINITTNITEPSISTNDSIVVSVFKFAFLRLRKTSASIAKRVTSAFVAKRSTSGAVK